MENHMLRVNDAVKVTGISRNTLYRYMRDNKLSYVERGGKRYLDRKEINALTPTDLAQQDLFSVSSDTKSDAPQLPSYAELCNEIKELRHSVTSLTAALIEICDKVTRNDTPQVVSSSPKDRPVSDNERRANEAQAKVFKVLEQYKDADKMPSIRAMAEEAGVERGTFSKHKKTWEAQNDVSV
ncbi:helix-turn-helix domain-containing protein [Vibrio sp. 10N.222.52.B7]|uniref:helix-turn-helix domain-containing protein n=1 Tax=Vibrio sp. 10N.222.52.B7 TaxID=3229629 RepID=UPI003553C6A4